MTTQLDLIGSMQRRIAELEAANATLQEVRGAGCQCGDDEACEFVRERDELKGRWEALKTTVAEMTERAAMVDCLNADKGKPTYVSVALAAVEDEMIRLESDDDT
jgi:hypothetical protein